MQYEWQYEWILEKISDGDLYHFDLEKYTIADLEAIAAEIMEEV